MALGVWGSLTDLVALSYCVNRQSIIRVKSSLIRLVVKHGVIVIGIVVVKNDYNKSLVIGFIKP